LLVGTKLLVTSCQYLNKYGFTSLLFRNRCELVSFKISSSNNHTFSKLLFKYDVAICGLSIPVNSLQGVSINVLISFSPYFKLNNLKKFFLIYSCLLKCELIIFILLKSIDT